MATQRILTELPYTGENSIAVYSIIPKRIAFDPSLPVPSEPGPGTPPPSPPPTVSSPVVASEPKRKAKKAVSPAPAAKKACVKKAPRVGKFGPRDGPSGVRKN
ncbi:hypothetical protein LTR78_002935 [Recurvomyces mirabilis]|uniref:Uncharacterized protein n=1 Tax=Recurvomyces mirabilis TaxID=574656 RepID=A0AAE0WTB0_9PEZI|nr:hypothetical protein LTR78_002935 [Recurvomyces mirabilis]KAK5159331.1 hypothetical protein LTS14_002473 [Recurvomyces mirabilis]